MAGRDELRHLLREAIQREVWNEYGAPTKGCDSAAIAVLEVLAERDASADTPPGPTPICPTCECSPTCAPIGPLPYGTTGTHATGGNWPEDAPSV